MNRNVIYEYAYWGAINHLEVLEKLYNMCLEVGDGDAAEEYECKIQKVKHDLFFIKRILNYIEV